METNNLNDFTIVLAGQAGQGVDSVSNVIAHIFKKQGYNVYVAKDVMSRVRGGMNSVSIRISNDRKDAFVERIDLLVSFHIGGYKHLKNRISKETVMMGIGDFSEVENNVEEIDFLRIAQDIGNRIFANIVAAGTVCGYVGIDKEIAVSQIKDFFSKKGEDVVEKNIKAFENGYTTGSHIAFKLDKEFVLSGREELKNYAFMSGAEAVGFGALAGGCNMMSSYPMSPATGVLTFLAQNAKKCGILVDQATDEIGAVNSVLGAWYAGARGMVTTSGGGFCLMTEAVSLSGMTETPLVVHIAQRPGPATGLPTRTAQEDLNLVLYAGHGEFMRAIFSPGLPEDAYDLVSHAFDIADRFQVPAFVLTDQHFVDAVYCAPLDKFEQKDFENHIEITQKDYKRYKLTDNGISPRGIPGNGEGLVMVDSDEHDEEGRITEDMEFLRPAMMEKRFFKRKKLLEEVALPPVLTGKEQYNTLIISWGTNKAVVNEAIDKCDKDDIAHAYFPQLFPFNKIAKEIIQKAQKVVVVENNATGQFANLLIQELGISVDERILSCNGKPFSVEDLVEEFNNL